MFKENKEFWFYCIGIVILFFVIFGVMRRGFSNNEIIFASFPFDIGAKKEEEKVYPTPAGGKLDINKNYIADVETNFGTFRIDLFEKNAPNTVASFINLVRNNYYDGNKFYRFKKGFLIQGGSRNTFSTDPADDKFGGPGYTLPDEVNWDSLDFDNELRQELTKLGYKSAYEISSKPFAKYSIAMAGAGRPDTLGSQFFILLAEEDDLRIRNLYGKHTVFAGVIDGFGVIEKFNAVPLDNPALDSPRPMKDIVINNITLYPD